jgi:hypothetical protein
MHATKDVRMVIIEKHFIGGRMSQADLLAKLCEWYKEQCNDDWEHGSGVLIDTLDTLAGQ